MNNKIKTEIIYYTGYTLQTFLNQFENLLDEYEHGKNKDDIENNEPNKYNIEVLNNLIRLTNIYLNLKPYIIKNIGKINY
jgi:hypothetical protein